MTQSLAGKLNQRAAGLLAIYWAWLIAAALSSHFLRNNLIALAYVTAFLGFATADLIVRPRYDPKADRDRRWILIGQLLWLALFFAAPGEREDFYGTAPPMTLSAFGLLVGLAGMSISLYARIYLGRFATPHLTVQEDQQIVRTGLYRYIRHPIYLGRILAALGWPLICGAPIMTVVVLTFGVLAVYRRLRVEESMMLEKFGSEYGAYMGESWRLIPGLW